MSGIGFTFLRRGVQAHPTAGSDYILSENRGDPEVFRILMSKGVSSDGVGITKDDAAKVKSIGTWFKGNTSITSFDELVYFGITALSDSTFNGCSNFRSFTLSDKVKTIGNYVCEKCTALERAIMPGVESIGMMAFMNTMLLTEVYMPMLNKIDARAFEGSGISGEHILEDFVVPAGKGFYSCPNLISMIAPNLSSISEAMLNRCTSLLSVYVGAISSVDRYAFERSSAMTALVINASSVPSLPYTDAFTNTSCTIYVPDSSVDAYKAASGWSTYASRIKGISQLATDNPIFYTKIQQYL